MPRHATDRQLRDHPGHRRAHAERGRLVGRLARLRLHGPHRQVCAVGLLPGRPCGSPSDWGGWIGRGAPIEWLATATGAHAMQTDPTNHYAFVPHIAGNGPNAIFQFTFDEHTGRLTPNAPAKVEPEALLGPRHFCFHPSLDILYFSNEQGCSVTGYRLDTATGTLAAFQTITTLPEGYTERNTCSQIQITASGRFLYAPNRGHNSIACFAVDTATGQLTATGRVASEPIPNALSLDPQDQFLFSAGQASGAMAVFRVDAES